MTTDLKFDPAAALSAPLAVNASFPALSLTTVSLVKEQNPPAPATTQISKVITGDNRMDPLIDDASYRFNVDSPVGSAVTVTFSFPSTLPSSYTGEDALGWQPFSEAQRTATREMLSLLQQQFAAAV